MKQTNKSMQQHQQQQQQQRSIKQQPLENGVERKLNYLCDSNHVKSSSIRVARRGRIQRSSDGGGGVGGGRAVGAVNQGGAGLVHRRSFKPGKKSSSSSQLRDELGTKGTRLKISTIASFLQSPRRNGLSPRDIIDELDEADEEEEDDDYGNANMSRAMQDQLDHHRGHRIKHHMHKPTYSCSSCGAQFHIKSLLGAHRRTHDDDFKVRFRGRRLPRESNTTLTAAAGKQCKYCDRVFDLERALHIHQLCHCNKITPQQRRKLGYTDLAHEKKNTPLPNFQRMPRGALPAHTTPDPNMPYVALGPAAIKMIEQEQQQKAKRRSIKYAVRVSGPMGRWR